MIIKGRVLKYEGPEADNINTDMIWPGSLTYHKVSQEDMRSMVMNRYDSSFQEKSKGANILAVGYNFGCGSSREQPAYALKYSGIEAIISPQFARIFERNALAAGIAAITSKELYECMSTGDESMIDLELGIAVTKDYHKRFEYDNMDAWQVQMGGLIELLAYEIITSTNNN
ncbi:MAG: 3-isopropylmalate dehydratase [Candidatus Woesearchaeota archaeon]